MKFKHLMSNDKPFGDKYTPYFVVQLKCKKQSWYGLEVINIDDMQLNTYW